MLRTLWFVSEQLGAPLRGWGCCEKRGIFASVEENLVAESLSAACHWDGFTGEQEWQEFMGLLLPGGGYPSEGVPQ